MCKAIEEGGLSTLVRPFHDLEMELVEKFIIAIPGKRFCQDVEHRILWEKSKNGHFSVILLNGFLKNCSVVLFLKKHHMEL